VYEDGAEPRLDVSLQPSGVKVVTPVVPYGGDDTRLVRELLAGQQKNPLILWYYTPMALAFSAHLDAELVVYDCMDELSAFHFAPPQLKTYEAELFEKADVVFTGGHSLYEAKRRLHANVQAFPSSVDAQHFRKGREAALADPADQANIPFPRLGFFGVIDERFDTQLVGQMADLRPDWSFVMIGPVAKIDPATLPQRHNIHWLGARSYDALPSYLAHWNLGLMPFALNASTRYISPTKTPEFLAAGLPVVSSAITDVMHPYGDLGLVEIAGEADAFVRRAQTLLARPREDWLARADTFLAGISWDKTWNAMHAAMRMAMLQKRKPMLTSLNGAGLNTAVTEGGHAGL